MKREERGRREGKRTEYPRHGREGLGAECAARPYVFRREQTQDTLVAAEDGAMRRRHVVEAECKGWLG